jgi:hypothetical protein
MRALSERCIDCHLKMIYITCSTCSLLLPSFLLHFFRYTTLIYFTLTPWEQNRKTYLTPTQAAPSLLIGSYHQISSMHSAPLIVAAMTVAIANGFPIVETNVCTPIFEPRQPYVIVSVA